MLTLANKIKGRQDAKKQKQVAADFTLQRGKDYHEALACPAVYDEERGKIGPIPAIRVRQEALNVYNDTIEESLRFSVKGCTFNDVFTELHEAEETYRRRASGPANILRKVGRTTGDYADETAPWCDLIPLDHGLNFLSAGLKIVIGIARRNADNRKKILDAFRDIPSLIIDTAIQLSQFASDPLLNSSAIMLYDTVAQSIAELIVLLNGSISSAARSADRVIELKNRFFSPSLVGMNIDDILGAFTTQCASIELETS
ncbi:hypothetical protein BJX70DRAFT_399020 [Aspergillus crustosus]